MGDERQEGVQGCFKTAVMSEPKQANERRGDGDRVHVMLSGGVGD